LLCGRDFSGAPVGMGSGPILAAPGTATRSVSDCAISELSVSYTDTICQA